MPRTAHLDLIKDEDGSDLVAALAEGTQEVLLSSQNSSLSLKTAAEE